MPRAIRLTRLTLCAGAAAAGLLAVAPATVLAAGPTGCSGGFSLASGQTTQCSFLYSGPNAGGEWTDSVGGFASGGPGVVSFRLEYDGTGGRQVIDHCEAISVSFSACGSGSSSGSPAVPPGTVVYCVVQAAVGTGVQQGNYGCTTGN